MVKESGYIDNRSGERGKVLVQLVIDHELYSVVKVNQEVEVWKASECFTHWIVEGEEHD